MINKYQTIKFLTSISLNLIYDDWNPMWHSDSWVGFLLKTLAI